MAQSVARNIGSVEVTGSIPVASFIIKYLIYISAQRTDVTDMVFVLLF